MLHRHLSHFTLFTLLLTVALAARGEFPLPANDLAKPSYLPVEEAYRLNTELTEQHLYVQWAIAEGYYLYQDKFRIEATLNGAPFPLEMLYPDGGKTKWDDYFKKDVTAYYHQIEFQFPRPAPHGLLQLKVRSQGCADAGLCYPPYKQTVNLDLGNGQWIPTPQISSSTGKSNPTEGRSTASSSVPNNSNSALTTTPVENEPTSLSWVLMAAFIGGAILNLMPCVFPVLSIKVLSLAYHANNSSGYRHGAAYGVGVVLSFVAIGGLLEVLKASGANIGWGFQLQQTWFVMLLALLFFAMGLSLSGVIQFGTQLMGLGQPLASRGGLQGSFFTGVLAVVAASPCTAPFMASALGYTLTQPAGIALLVFAFLGLGMATPFVLLASFPLLANLMPKPGAWMETFKQILAFPLYLTVVWLLWVIGSHSGVDAMALATIGCVALAFGLWLWQRGGLVGRGTAVASLVSALWLSSSLPQATALETGDNKWQPYHPQQLAQLRADNTPVFINLTAAWCVTCLANEHIALSSERFYQALEQKGVVYMKGDWTDGDPQITELLGEHGRNGVPLYLLYPGDQKPAQILPQVLSEQLVVEKVLNL